MNRILLAGLLSIGAALLPSPTASALSYPPIPTSGQAQPVCSESTTSSTLTQAQMESEAQAIRSIVGSHLQSIAPCTSGRFFLGLTPGSEDLAKQVQAKYGSDVTISVGLTTWHGHAGRSPLCGALPTWTTPPPGLGLALRLDSIKVRSGELVRGIVTVTNNSATPFFMDTGQPLQAVIVRRGTRTPVGVYTGGIAGTGYGVRLSKGHSETIPVLVGTARCDGGIGSAVPPGHYQAVVLVMDETGKGPRYLTPPASLLVTPA